MQSIQGHANAIKDITQQVIRHRLNECGPPVTIIEGLDVLAQDLTGGLRAIIQANMERIIFDLIGDRAEYRKAGVALEAAVAHNQRRASHNLFVSSFAHA